MQAGWIVLRVNTNLANYFDISREYSPWEKWMDFHSLKENWPQGNLRWNIFLLYESWRSHISLHCISREFQRDKTLTFLFSKRIMHALQTFRGILIRRIYAKNICYLKECLQNNDCSAYLSCLFRHPCAVLMYLKNCFSTTTNISRKLD